MFFTRDHQAESFAWRELEAFLRITSSNIRYEFMIPAIKFASLIRPAYSFAIFLHNWQYAIGTVKRKNIIASDGCINRH